MSAIPRVWCGKRKAEPDHQRQLEFPSLGQLRLRAAYGKSARASNCRLVPAFSSATPTFFYSSDPDSWVVVLFSVGGQNIVHRFCAHRSLILRELFREIHRLLQSRVRFLLQGLRLFRALIASAPRILSIPFRIQPARVSPYVFQFLAFFFSWECRGHADAMVARFQPDNWMLRLAQTFFPSPNRCYGPGTRL
jgi:hypothetical protein